MDDFSFPTIAVDKDSHCQLSFPHFAASPLWFFTCVRTEADAGMQRRSLSATMETPELLTRDFRFGSMKTETRGQEERMDMLWEDFNEELCRMSRKPRGSLNKMNNRGLFDRKQKDMELCCVHALRESQNRSMLHRRKTGLILMLKVLKKLFLIHKATSSRSASIC